MQTDTYIFQFAVDTPAANSVMTMIFYPEVGAETWCLLWKESPNLVDPFLSAFELLGDNGRLSALVQCRSQSRNDSDSTPVNLTRKSKHPHFD